MRERIRHTDRMRDRSRSRVHAADELMHLVGEVGNGTGRLDIGCDVVDRERTYGGRLGAQVGSPRRHLRRRTRVHDAAEPDPCESVSVIPIACATGRAHAYMRRTSSCTWSARSATGPAVSTSGATSLIGSGRTGAGSAPRSALHVAICADELAYTMRPSPTHACAAEHIGQCSPEV